MLLALLDKTWETRVPGKETCTQASHLIILTVLKHDSGDSHHIIVQQLATCKVVICYEAG